MRSDNCYEGYNCVVMYEVFGVEKRVLMRCDGLGWCGMVFLDRVWCGWCGVVSVGVVWLMRPAVVCGLFPLVAFFCL